VRRLVRARQAQLEPVPPWSGDDWSSHDAPPADGADPTLPDSSGQPGVGRPPGMLRSAAGILGSLLTGSARRVGCASVAAIRELIQFTLSVWLVLPAMLLPHSLPPPARAIAQLPGLAAALALGPAGVTALQAGAAAAAAAAAWLHLSLNLPPLLASPAAAAAPLPADQAHRRVVEMVVPLLAARVAAALPWHRLALRLARWVPPILNRRGTGVDRTPLLGGGGRGRIPAAGIPAAGVGRVNSRGGGMGGSEGAGGGMRFSASCEQWEADAARPDCAWSAEGGAAGLQAGEPPPSRYLDPAGEGPPSRYLDPAGERPTSRYLDPAGEAPPSRYLDPAGEPPPLAVSGPGSRGRPGWAGGRDAGVGRSSYRWGGGRSAYRWGARRSAYRWGARLIVHFATG
jgi:hypothetical protein